ncbi:MAG: SAM-dependent chlorinase/fluorinase [Candidatus Alcyoniella australis]|nr:SAM-dependent chlorinase/fluorinase [Candidatus Alcyoniella australis]
MRATKLVTLLSDFGPCDPYAGAMKGAVLAVDPSLQLVDITHQIEPQNVLAGALSLRAYAFVFPAGTVHLAVVDPEVGAERRPMVAQANGRMFVGPDNGLFTFVLGPQAEAFEIADPGVFRQPVSPVFHGRDIFGPAAGHLACGRSPATFGPRIDQPVRLMIPRPHSIDGGVEGEVMHIDCFGNLTTNVPSQLLSKFGPPQRLSVEIGGQLILGMCSNYSEAQHGGLLMLVGSAGFVEIAVNQGSAAKLMNVEVGHSLRIIGSQTND